MTSGPAGTAIRLRIVPGRCQGHGLCYERYPDLFTWDDEGYVVLRGDVVNGDAATRAAEAVRFCPEQAIVVEPAQ